MRNETIFGLIVFVLLPWFALCGCNDSGESETNTNLTDEVDEGAFGQIKEFTYVRTIRDRTEFELTARSAVFFALENRVDLSNTEAVFIGKNGRKMFLKADNGQIRTETGDMAASGNVVVRTDAGYKATTEVLNYRAEGQLITSDHPVRIDSDTMVITGTGLELPVEEQTLELKENVKALLKR